MCEQAIFWDFEVHITWWIIGYIGQWVVVKSMRRCYVYIYIHIIYIYISYIYHIYIYTIYIYIIHIYIYIYHIYIYYTYISYIYVYIWVWSMLQYGPRRSGIFQEKLLLKGSHMFRAVALQLGLNQMFSKSAGGSTIFLHKSWGFRWQKHGDMSRSNQASKHVNRLTKKKWTSTVVNPQQHVNIRAAAPAAEE